MCFVDESLPIECLFTTSQLKPPSGPLTTLEPEYFQRYAVWTLVDYNLVSSGNPPKMASTSLAFDYN